MNKEDKTKEYINRVFPCMACIFYNDCMYGIGNNNVKEYNCPAFDEAESFKSGWGEALKSQWISVEEKKPNDLEKVLLASLYEGETLYSVGYMFNGKWVTSNNKPFAWMQIPSFDDILENNKDVLKRLKDK